MANAISNLPFGPDVPVTVVLTGSPFKIKPRSQVKFKVFFSVPGQDTLKAVDQPWTSMQLFSSGQQFINGSFIGFDRKEEEKTLFVREISDIQEDQIKNHLDFFNFKLPKEEAQLNEECITFLSKGLTFVVPCMQIIRTFYATHRFLVKNITTQQDLSAFIESESKNEISAKIELTFKEWLSEDATKPMVNSFVLVYYIPELKKGWERIVSNYINTGIFKASLPIIPNLQLTFKGYKIDDFFYVNRIIWCNEPKLPFRWLLYYPQKDKMKKEKRTKKEAEKAINTEKALKSDNLVVNEPGVSPGKSSPTKRIRSPKTQAFSLFHKIQRAGDLKAADKSSPLYSVEEGFDIVSTKSPTDKGTAKKLDIIASKNTIDIPSNESFPDFCMALNDLQYLMDIKSIIHFTGECPDDFSYCKNDSGGKRKYMVADIGLNNYYYHWLVIDLENTNNSTSAMLIIRKNDYEDAETQASKLINKLVYTGKGHWTSSCFDEIEGLRLPYNTLKHYKNRSSFKWAFWIQKKINALYKSKW